MVKVLIERSRKPHPLRYVDVYLAVSLVRSGSYELKLSFNVFYMF